jgi:hypothetical protein
VAELHLYRRIIPGRPKLASRPISGSVCFTNLPTFILGLRFPFFIIQDCHALIYLQIGYLMYGCTVLLPSTFNLDKMNPYSLLSAFDRFSSKLFAVASSPAFASKLAHYALAHGRTIPARHCCVGGAPVFKHELETLIEAITGTVWVAYGSSEAEPMGNFNPKTNINHMDLTHLLKQP